MHSLSLNALTPPLPLTVWTATGPDARSFLQGQLTQDTERLSPPTAVRAGQHQLSGACTPKGRLLASFIQWAVDDASLAQITPQAVAPSLIKRLRMYVLRAKVTLDDAAWTVRGAWLNGEQAQPGLVEQLDEQLWLLQVRPDPSGLGRGLLVGSPSGSDAWALAQSPRSASELDWWAAEIRSGQPWVWPETQEAFVPQMLNFDLLDGIGFKKGCYTGQEVVARSQYLGKLNRRMFLFSLESDSMAHHPPGTLLFQTDQDEPVGDLVMQASGVLLASVGLESIQAVIAGRSSLHLAGPAGPQLTPGPLPYEVPTEPQQVNRPRLT
ncbi:MAG: hypothetical protein RLY30_1769 [Pseudomonadota bacterium]|jgi:folate-binding protein YgfZ